MNRQLFHLDLIKKGLLFAVLFLGLIACKKKDDPTPVPSSKVTITPSLSWANYIFSDLTYSSNLDKFNSKIKFYEGDTIRYNLKIETSNNVSSISVYKVNLSSNSKTLIPGYPKTQFALPKSIDEKLIYEVPTDSSTGRFKLMIEVSESNGTSKSFDILTINGIHKLNTMFNQSIYEYHDWNDGQNYLNQGEYAGVYYDGYADTVLCGQIGNINYVNAMFLPYIQCNFNSAGCTPGVSSARYNLKLTLLEDMATLKILDTNSVSFESVQKANQLKDLYEKNSNSPSSYIKNFSKGLIIGKYIWGGYQYAGQPNRPLVYYLIKITVNRLKR